MNSKETKTTEETKYEYDNLGIAFLGTLTAWILLWLFLVEPWLAPTMVWERIAAFLVWWVPFILMPSGRHLKSKIKTITIRDADTSYAPYGYIEPDKTTPSVVDMQPDSDGNLELILGSDQK